MTWFAKVRDDLNELPDALNFYEQEYLAARLDLKIQGNIDRLSSNLPGIVEQRFAQLQEIEAILEHLNIQLKKLRSKNFRKYLEAYNKALSSRDAEKYADGEDEITQMEQLINEVALLRNKYLGVTKGLDNKQWMITNLVKLKVAGMEDFKL